MEYFDFDQAAREDDIASDCQEIGDADSLYCNDDDLPDLDTAAPSNPPEAFPNDANDQHEPDQNVEPGPEAAYPMQRAEVPCYFCEAMGLDCFVAQRGAFQPLGCTCCIALYRKCSFTHEQPEGQYMDTLHVVGEDAPVQTGGPTGIKVLKSLTGPSNGHQRKSGARFSREAVRVLKSWLSEHLAHPYPTDEEKAELKAKTGLKKSQISNWLANARRRGKVRPPFQSNFGTPAVYIPRKDLPPGVSMSELTPLERWKHSPPENEPASARDILQAMATTSFRPATVREHGHVRSNSRRTGSSNDEGSISNARPARSSSGRSFNTSKSDISDMSFASAFSHRSSHASFTSGETRERRRRRHKSTVGLNPFQKSRGSRPYQCTFCTDTFATKYDWQRHEKSLHLALDQWICAPQGGVIQADGELFCAFCRHPNPDEDHLESHNYSTCQEKTIQERTFYRKDHLNQHLRLMHSVKLGAWMDPWRSTITQVKSRCGFCSATLTTWKERVDHLAVHFKAGTQMTEWKGDWGFEPHIQEMVENSIPPYLIGQERKTMNPYVASQQKSDAQVPGVDGPVAPSRSLPVPDDANCFRRLEVELSAYVARMMARGEIPTDEMIQAEARQIIYGDADDTWNQTCADNPTWLAIFKRNLGLCEPSDAPNLQLEDLGMQPPFAAPGGLSQPPQHSVGTAPRRALTPTYSSSAFHSAAPSMQHSLASSLAGSRDIPLSLSGSGGFTSSESFTFLSTSAPVMTALRSTAQTSCDAKYLHGLGSNDFGDLSHALDDMQLESLLDPGGTTGPEHPTTSSASSLKATSGVHPSIPFTTATREPVNIPATTGSFDPGYHTAFYPPGSYSGGSPFPSYGFHPI
ncbi:hypothetical protein VTO42DRAFT_2555 [Malbranchea cinnamomea]